MYSVDEKTNAITMTRGDSLAVLVRILRDGEPYDPREGDAVRFYLKRGLMNLTRTEYRDPIPLVSKTIPNGTMVLKLEPEDTKTLGFGEYKYDIELTFADGRVDTFINNANLILAPEVG